MGLVDLIKQLLGLGGAGRGTRRGGRRRQGPAEPQPREEGLGLMELSRRLGLPVSVLQAIPVDYDEFTIPKRSGGKRTILAPGAELKRLQRTVLRKLLSRLKAHPAATGFERGRSIATNARPHVAAAVLVRMDVRNFFLATAARRVREYFRAIGWDGEAADQLLKWTTRDGGLPQGAPTSPRLSNLVNYEMDTRLAALAERIGCTYSRYADDITFSLPADDRAAVATVIRATKDILADYGYILHLKRKLSIRRRHQSQRVTGLVVNERVALPRRTRRRLRAIRHHLGTGRPATLTEAQLAGWGAFTKMIERQGSQ